MRYFYIDTENFSDYSFIKNWNVCSKNDTIIFFVSENTGSIKLKLLSGMYANSVNIVFEEVSSGEKNAMDTQIISLLSINAERNKNCHTEHYIVSDDSDYHSSLKNLAMLAFFVINRE